MRPRTRSHFFSTVVLVGLAGVITGLGAAGHIGPFAALGAGAPHTVAAQLPGTPLRADSLYPAPTKPPTVHEIIVITDPAPTARPGSGYSAGSPSATATPSPTATPTPTATASPAPWCDDSCGGGAAVETTEVAEYRPDDRDKAFKRVASWTIGGVSGVVAVTGALTAVSAAGFAAAASAPVERVPPIPPEPAPFQSTPPSPAVIIKVVHLPAPAGVSTEGPSRISPPRVAPVGVCERFIATASAPAPAATGMPLDSNASVLTSRAFRAMGTMNVVAVIDPDALAPATAAARG